MNKRDVTLDMIKSDTAFFLDLGKQIQKSNVSGILIFGLLPYLSLYVLETYQYFEKENPANARVLLRRHKDIIRASRARIKLFEVDELFNLLQSISKIHHERFIQSHKGLLAWMKKLIQPDLGLFAYDAHLISTTHTAHLNIGYEKEDFFKKSESDTEILLRSLGFEIGQYVGALYEGFGGAQSNDCLGLCSYDLEEKLVKMRDVKSAKYYKHIFNGDTSSEINSSLTMLLATANFFNHIFKRLVIETPDTFFKIKFVTLYQLIISLNKLQDYYYPKGLLTPKSKEYLKEILSDKDVQLIKTKTKLRNIFVHYDVANNLSKQTFDDNVRLYGLVEQFFEGQTLMDVDAIISCQLLRISEILETWSKSRT